MKSETCLIDFPLGAVHRGPIQFIKQLVVEAEKDLFELTLPGQITRCNGASTFAIKSAGRIVIDCALPERAATVSAQILDKPGLTHAIHKLLDKIEVSAEADYNIRLASSQSSFADVIEQAEKAAGGCGCDGCVGTAGIIGSVSVGLSKKRDGKLIWSQPVRSVIQAQVSNGGEYGGMNPKQTAFALGPNTTACLSIWHGLIDRWTECIGPCSSGTCSCRKTSGGTPVVGCKDWGTCTCQ